MIRYSLNDGTGISYVKEGFFNEKWPKLDNITTRTGYEFIGFYMPDGVTKIYDNVGAPTQEHILYLTDKIVLQAIWKEKNYGIVLYSIHLDEVTNVPDMSVYHPLGLGYYSMKYSDILSYEAPEEMTYIKKDSLGSITYKRLFSHWDIIRGSEYDFNATTNPWIEISNDRKLEISIEQVFKTYYSDLKDNEIITFRAYYATYKFRGNNITDETINRHDDMQIIENQENGKLFEENIYIDKFLYESPVIMIKKYQTVDLTAILTQR